MFYKLSGNANINKKEAAAFVGTQCPSSKSKKREIEREREREYTKRAMFIKAIDCNLWIYAADLAAAILRYNVSTLLAVVQ